MRKELAPAWERLLARSIRDETTGCLRWQGAHISNGYGQMSFEGRIQPVHRIAYKLHIGPIPDGYEVDHVRAWGCQHRDCFEPTHLEAVTQAENAKRADHRRKVCPPDHVGWVVKTPSGGSSRECHTCSVLQKRAYRARRKAEGISV